MVARYETTKTFEGVIPNLERRFRDTESSWSRDHLSKFQSTAMCETCEGKRLRPEALAVKWLAWTLRLQASCPLNKRANDLPSLVKSCPKQDMEIADRILKEIDDRLSFLNAVGLDYLTLARGSGSLSGGESQRIRLASQIGSGLTGVLYVARRT